MKQRVLQGKLWCVCILLRSSVYGLLTFFSFLNLFFLPLRQVVKPSFNLMFNPLCWLVLRASGPFTQKLWGVLVFTRKFSLNSEFGINDLEILLCSLTDNLRGTISLCLFFNLAVCTINWKLYIYIFFFFLATRWGIVRFYPVSFVMSSFVAYYAW